MLRLIIALLLIHAGCLNAQRQVGQYQALLEKAYKRNNTNYLRQVFLSQRRAISPSERSAFNDTIKALYDITESIFQNDSSFIYTLSTKGKGKTFLFGSSIEYGVSMLDPDSVIINEIKASKSMADSTIQKTLSKRQWRHRDGSINFIYLENFYEIHSAKIDTLRSFYPLFVG
jgi:hypothetical protein